MFAAVRRYSGPGESLVDALVGRTAAIHEALVEAAGVCGGDVISTREGLIVVVVGEDEDSVVEAERRFAVWAERDLPALHALTLEVWSGEVLVHGSDRPSAGSGWPISARHGSG